MKIEVGNLVKIIYSPDQPEHISALVGNVGILIKEERGLYGHHWVLIGEKIYNFHILDLKIIYQTNNKNNNNLYAIQEYLEKYDGDS